MNKRLFTFLVLFVCFLPGFSQSLESVLPFSEQYQLQPVVDFINMPEFDYSKMITEDEASMDRGEKRFRFARKIPVDIIPYSEGLWEDVPSGGKVWRIGIRSVKAYSLYVVCRNFEINKGVRIFAYNSSKTDSYGPFSNVNNSAGKVLVIPPVKGNEIIIELNVDAGVDNFGTLEIKEIWHDYRNIYDKSRLKSTNSGNCNVDINCEAGQPWQTQKRAVCKYLANGLYCTGTLVNNTRGDKIPYLITAYHCINDADDAATSLYYFDYEKPVCKGAVVSKPKIVNGAELKATTPHQLDFTLVKLNRFPAITDGLYLAGWDARADSPPNGICIHHPSGDVKKISVTKRALYTSDFGEGFNNNSHWLVSKWDIGTTEGGSSGASLFDSQYHIVGILSGGDATCDNSVNDYFAKFTLAWDFYPDSSKQLKYWLDPDNTGLRVLSGSAPYGLYKPGCDTVSNVLKTEGLANSSTGSWGYLSGHNSFNDDAFAEKFTISGSIDISGIFITPSVVTPGNAFANVVFKIWDGTDAPSHEIYSKPYYMKYLEPGMQNFIEFDSLVHLSGSFFIGYSINYASPADTFAMYHAENRNSGLSTMFVKRNNYWQIITDINSSFHTSMAIGFASCQPLEKPVNDELPIYPNPAFTDFYINLPLNTQASNLECFNMVGKKQYIEWHVETDKLVVDVRSLISGIYGLRFFINGKEYVKRFVVIQQK